MVMTTWGNKMLAAVHTVSQMAAVGFGLPADAFTQRMAYGPHLLAPTGTLQLLLSLRCHAVSPHLSIACRDDAEHVSCTLVPESSQWKFSRRTCIH